MSEHGEFLDYAERESRRTLDYLRAAFNAHFERALKVLTLLTGGAGAVLAYAFNHWPGLGLPARAALLVLALGWGVAAVHLATRGMRARRLGAGAMLTALAGTYSAHVGDPMRAQSATAAARALRVVRMAELNREHLQTQAYARAVGEQTQDLRRAVVLASLVPLLAVAAWALAPHL